MQISHLFHQGDSLEVLQKLPDGSVHCCITSPPYWGLRDYGVDGQIGLEETPEQYVNRLVEVFREVRRVLRSDGTLWLNLGDSYRQSGGFGHKREATADSTTEMILAKGGRYSQDNIRLDIKRDFGDIKPKDLVGIPWMVAFALRADGWYLRSDIIWSKPSPMPESVTDRPTKSHEHVFLLTKSASYYYDAEAIREVAVEGKDLGLLRSKTPTDGKHVAWHAPSIKQRQCAGVDSRTAGTGYRNKRTVWTIATQSWPEAHFATFPEKLVEPCILAGTSERGACPKCGAPWERVIERTPATSKERPKTQAAHEARGGVGKSVGTVGKCGRIDGHTKTLGFQPTCTCPNNDGSGACVVLDPFGGSGTVSCVAKRLSRSSIYIDLNPDYLKMAIKRMGNQETLFEQHSIEVIQ